MGDDKDKKLQNSGTQIILGIIVILAIFNYLYYGTELYGTLLTLAGFIGVLLLIKGVWDYFIHGILTTFWTGSGVCIALILLFDGLQIVLNAFSTIIGLFNYVLVLLSAV